MNTQINSKKEKLYFTIKYFIVKFTFTLFVLFLQTSLFSQVTVATQQNNHSKDSATGITIHQEVNFKVPPQRLYEVLLNSKQFSACTKKSFDNFTATSATIDSAVGGTFTVFDGHILGRILELVPGRRIVEAWRVVDWPAGVYSIARFEFNPNGSGTQLIFDHVGFPEGLKEHLAEGWQQHYWDALNKYFQ